VFDGKKTISLSFIVKTGQGFICKNTISIMFVLSTKCALIWTFWEKNVYNCRSGGKCDLL